MISASNFIGLVCDVEGIIFAHLPAADIFRTLLHASSIADYAAVRECIGMSSDRRYTHIEGTDYAGMIRTDAKTMVLETCAECEQELRAARKERAILLASSKLRHMGRLHLERARVGKQAVSDELKLAVCHVDQFTDVRCLDSNAMLMDMLTGSKFTGWLVGMFLQRYMLGALSFGEPYLFSRVAQVDTSALAWVKQVDSKTNNNFWRCIKANSTVKWPVPSQYARAVLTSTKLFNPAVISPRAACVRNRRKQNALFSPSKNSLDVLVLCKHSRGKLLYMGLLEDVDGLGHSALQLLANAAGTMRVEMLYSALQRVLGSEDVMTTLGLDGRTTVYSQIIAVHSSLLLGGRNHPRHMFDTYAEKREAFFRKLLTDARIRTNADVKITYDRSCARLIAAERHLMGPVMKRALRSRRKARRRGARALRVASEQVGEHASE